MELAKVEKEELKELYDNVLYLTKDEKETLIEALAHSIAEDTKMLLLAVSKEGSTNVRNHIIESASTKLKESAELLETLVGDSDDDCDGDCENCPFHNDDEDDEDECEADDDDEDAEEGEADHESEG